MGLRRLVVSDLDGTLLGDVEALHRFAVWHAAQRDSVVLAYATGRHPREVRSAVANDGLPEPDLVIAALGTEIVDRRQRIWGAWSGRFEGAHGERVRAALRPVSWLELQPAVHQSALKASYDVRDLSAADLGSVERILADARIQARLIHSGGGSYLDVVPAGSGKGPATEFIARALGQKPEDVFTFGDSGNDVDLLTAGFSATIVANALPEVDSAVGSWAYRSPYRYAAGVLDGIRHWSQRSRGPRRRPDATRIGVEAASGSPRE